MTNQMKLYGFTHFDRSGKVRWLLTELGLKFEDKWISSANKDYETSEYLKLNPLGRVPVLEVGNLSLFESGAICTYIADLHLDRGLAPPLGSKDRAKYLQWMYFSVATLDDLQIRMMIIEDIPDGKVRSEKDGALFSDMNSAMDALNRELSETTYLVGNSFSTADICVSYHLYFLQLWPEFSSITSKFPNVVSYLNRLMERPAAIESKVFSYKENL